MYSELIVAIEELQASVDSPPHENVDEVDIQIATRLVRRATAMLWVRRHRGTAHRQASAKPASFIVSGYETAHDGESRLDLETNQRIESGSAVVAKCK